MKKVALSKMKCATLFAMMLFSYQGMSQPSSVYVGDTCKIYPPTSYDIYNSFAMAHLVKDEHNPSAKYLMADKVFMIKKM